MLKLKDLLSRQYVGKQCKTFDYILKDDDGAEVLTARFVNMNEKTWSAQFVMNRAQNSNGQISWIDYEMPKAGMPLEKVAATGLRLFQLNLKEEIQIKMNLDFALGEKLEGM